MTDLSESQTWRPVNGDEEDGRVGVMEGIPKLNLRELNSFVKQYNFLINYSFFGILGKIHMKRTLFFS